MIPSNEMRIGNWYYLENPMACAKVPEQFSSWTQALDFEAYGIPIPLSDEILEKTNLIAQPFKKSEQRLFCAPEHIREKSAKDEGVKYCSFFFNARLGKWMDTQSRVCVMYLHQLQTLYFAHTGEELTVKL